MNQKKKEYSTFLLGGLISLVCLIGCTNKPQKTGKRTFPMVTVPTIYAAQQARAEYLAMHYWDQFDFNDTTYVGSSAMLTEQAITDFLSVLPYASYDMICKGITHLLDQADQNQAMYAFFSSKMEFYLSNPNSALRNEEFYIPVVEHMIACNSLDQPRKVRPNSLLPLLQKNRPSTQAANIHYTLPSGAKDSLTNLKSDYILVLFHSLDCESCRNLIKVIEASPVIKEMQSQKKLSVFAIYPFSDVEGWKKYLTEMPSSWIKGYDHNEEIGGKGTYVIESFPMLYLLDKNHMVIMKNAPFNYVEYYLNSILNPPTDHSATLNPAGNEEGGK